MYICNQGELFTNRLLTDAEKLAIIKYFNNDHALDIEDNENQSIISFEEYYSKHFDAQIKGLIEKGIPIISGTIEYWGDYEGKIYVRLNKNTGEVIVEEVDISEVGLMEASDEKLISILKDRGYTVTKIA